MLLRRLGDTRHLPAELITGLARCAGRAAATRFAQPLAHPEGGWRGFGRLG
jgi:hypothetical protein